MLAVSLVKELRNDPQYQALHPHAPELAAVPGPLVPPTAVLDEQAAEDAAEERLVSSATRAPRSSE